MSCRNAEQERIAGALHSVELALAGTSIYKSSSKLLDGHSFTPGTRLALTSHYSSSGALPLHGCRGQSRQAAIYSLTPTGSNPLYAQQ